MWPCPPSGGTIKVGRLVGWLVGRLVGWLVGRGELTCGEATAGTQQVETAPSPHFQFFLTPINKRNQKSEKRQEACSR